MQGRKMGCLAAKGQHLLQAPAVHQPRPEFSAKTMQCTTKNEQLTCQEKSFAGGSSCASAAHGFQHEGNAKNNKTGTWLKDDAQNNKNADHLPRDSICCKLQLCVSRGRIPRAEQGGSRSTASKLSASKGPSLL
eukprot:1152015-Pelagomonas_calceolata.AAC.10